MYTLQQRHILVFGHLSAGIWLSGAAISQDINGNLYVGTGNGASDDVNNWGTTVVKFPPSSTVNWVPSDYFTPPDAANGGADIQDIASGLLQYSVGTSNFILMGIKDGPSYLLNQDNLGHVYPNSLQNWTLPYHIFTDYVQCGNALFLHPSNGPVFRYPLNSDGTINLAAATNNPTIKAGKGCAQVVSQATNGDLMLWETNCGPLVAYDCNTLAILYSSSNTGDSNDRTGQITSHYNPLVVNGKIYVAQKNPSEMLVYGRQLDDTFNFP